MLNGTIQTVQRRVIEALLDDLLELFLIDAGTGSTYIKGVLHAYEKVLEHKKSEGIHLDYLKQELKEAIQGSAGAAERKIIEKGEQTSFLS